MKIIIGITLIVFVYNLFDNSFFELSKSIDISSVLSGYGFKGSESFISVLFKYFISFVFNINIENENAIFIMFGV